MILKKFLESLPDSKVNIWENCRPDFVKNVEYTSDLAFKLLVVILPYSSFSQRFYATYSKLGKYPHPRCANNTTT